MGRGKRAFIGALVGAFLALSLHPSTRPLLYGVFRSEQHQSPSLELVASKQGSLTSPKTLLEHGLWMLVASERISRGKYPSDEELENVLWVAQNAAKADPENAYWRQMSSVFLESLGRTEESQAEWISASRRISWNDMQTDLLDHKRADLRRQTGGTPFAWQTATVYFLRSNEPAKLLEEHSRKLLSHTGFDTREDLNLRYATLVNGDLIRAGGRSLATSSIGASMLEKSSYPSDLVNEDSKKKLLLARYQFFEQLRENRMPIAERNADKLYVENEGWIALTEREDIKEDPRLLAIISVFTANIASSCLALSILGLLVWWIGKPLVKRYGAKSHFSKTTLIVVGLLVGVIISWMTFAYLTGLVIATSIFFLAFSPKNERTLPSESLGPLFKFMVGLIGVSFALIVCLFLVSTTSPALVIKQIFQANIDVLFAHSVLMGLAALIFSLLILLAPTYAFAQRRSTASVFAVAVRNFGIVLGVGGIIAAVILTPVSLYADRQIGHTMDKLLANEPLHYIHKQ